MRKEIKKAPTIRFRGFTEDWEQRKWIDVVDISTEMVNPTTGEYDNMPHIAPGNIESFTGRILDNVKTVKEEQLISGKYRFRPDDVVYGKINPQLGKYFYATVNGLTSADAYVFNGKNGLKQKFLFALLQTSDFFKYSVSVSKRSGMPKINRDELNAYCFLMPSEEEQDKIGTYLLLLDNLITLHQRKFDELKTAKTYFLQNMFPAKGEKVPRIRFHGFTGDWEQRKLGDVTEFIRNGYTYKADCSRNHRYKIARIESISSGKLNIEKLGSSDIINKNYRLKAGDILFSHINSLPYIANTAIYTDNLGEIYHGMNLLNIRTIPQTIKPHFLLYLLKKESSRQWFRTIANPAVNQASISTAEVRKFVFFIPTINEQNKIADFFRNLDNLITLHQHKLNQLKALKKFMLQNLFI